VPPELPLAPPLGTSRRPSDLISIFTGQGQLSHIIASYLIVRESIRKLRAAAKVEVELEVEVTRTTIRNERSQDGPKAVEVEPQSRQV
jgi:hypothetical protein